MEKIVLKLHEILSLEYELNGIKELKGFLNLDLPIGVKFDLKKVLTTVLENKKSFTELNEGLFKKYGELKDNQYVILDENKENFMKDQNELLLKDIDLEYIPIKKSILYDVKTTDDYNVIYKLIGE